MRSSLLDLLLDLGIYDETGRNRMANRVLKSEWYALALATERERIAQAIEAERDDKPAGIGDGPIVKAYQGGLLEAARIARTQPN